MMTYAIFGLDGIKSSFVGILFLGGIIIGIGLGILIAMPSKTSLLKEKH